MDMHSSEILKDYILPVTGAICSAILAGVIAVIVNKNQQSSIIERERVHAFNEMILKVERILSAINEVKRLYAEYLNVPEKRFRVFRIPVLRYQLPDYSIDTSWLAFLYPKDESVESKWDASRIDAMLANYRLFKTCLSEVSGTAEKIREVVINHYGASNPFVEWEFIENTFSQAEIVNFNFSYEFLIKLNDNLIIQMTEFLTEISGVAEKALTKSIARQYGLVTIKGVSGHLLLQRCSDPDYEHMAMVQGVTVEYLKQRIKTSYDFQ